MASRTRGPVVFLALLLAVVVVGGGFLLLRGRGGGSDDRATAERLAPRPSVFASDPDSERGEGSSAIEAVVLDEGGAPQAGATVILARTSPSGVGWTSSLGRPVAVGKTDAGGRFRFDRLQRGSYSLSAMMPRLAPASRGPVEVTEGQTREVELRLTGGGVLLSGRVLDASGGVVPGARVRAMEANFTDPAGGIVPRVFQAVANEQGEYQLHLGVAQYSLTAEADGYAPTGDWFTLARDTVRDLRMSPAARLMGRVIDGKTREPVADADLWLVVHRQGGGRPRDVKTDAEGIFAFNDLEPGTYRVGARKGRLVGLSGPVSLALAGAQTDVEVLVHGGLVVAGRVSSAGRPVPDARLDLFKADPPMERPTFAKTDQQGRFRIEGVLPANYRLQAKAGEHAPTRQELRVTADKEDLELKLGPGSTLTGKVVTAGGQAVPEAVVNVQVRPPRDAAMAFAGGAYERATTAADGTFVVKGLPAGELVLTAQHKEFGVASVRDQKIAEGETRTLSLTLDAAGSVTGKVVMDDGRPAVGARIEAQARGVGMGGGRWSDLTGPDGSYRLRGIPAGTVIVVAGTGRGMTWSSQDRPDQKTITLSQGEQKTGVDLVVPGATSISGVVVDPDGKPVSGAEVSAGRERDGGSAHRGSSMNGRVFSGQDGTFTIGELGAGQHTVWAVHAGFADAEVKHVDANATSVRLQLALEGTLAGVVTTSDGKPVSDYTITLAPGVKVVNETPQDRARRLASTSWDNPTDVVHDPSGGFLFRRVNAGDHELQVKTADNSGGTLNVSVGPGERKTGLRVVIESGARVVGKVVDLETGSPLAGLDVHGFVMGTGGPRAPVRTDATGAFAVDGVAPGAQMSLTFLGQRQGHVNERRRVEVSKGQKQVDLGTIKLVRGDIQARIKEGTWDGFTGINNTEDDKHTILTARPGTPAEKAGLKPGDVILAVDGKDVTGFSSGAIEFQLRGRPGTPISVTVQTPGQAPRTVSFTRYGADRPPPGASPPAAQGRAAAPAAPATGQTPPASGRQ